MQVSLAAIHIAHIVAFGTELPSDKAYSIAAGEIEKARQDWPTLMRISDAVKDTSVPYSELALRAKDLLEKATLLDKATDAWNAARPQHNMPRTMILEKMAPEFDRLQPYGFAKKYGVLVNGSAEDFAVEFMTAFNNECYKRY